MVEVTDPVRNAVLGAECGAVLERRDAEREAARGRVRGGARCVAHESSSGRVTVRCPAPASTEPTRPPEAPDIDIDTGNDPNLVLDTDADAAVDTDHEARGASVPSLAAVVDALRAALAAGGEVAGIDDEGLCGEVLALEELRRAIDVAEGARLAELDRRDCTATAHGLVTHRWLAREAMLPAGVARDRVKVGKAVAERFDRLGPAVEAGRISWDHAKAVVGVANLRVVDALGDLQDDLIDLAEATVFERWRRELSGIVTLVDQDGGHDPGGDDTRTQLRMTAILDNASELRGTLVGDDAAIVAHTIDTIADELHRRAVKDHETCPDLPVPTRTVLRAKALVEICRRAMARDIHDTRPPRPELILVTHASDPLADVATIDGAVLVQDGTRRRLECIADWYPVVVDSLGVPLDHGRAVRFATAVQRRALAVRDGGCVYPGCDAPCHGSRPTTSTPTTAAVTPTPTAWPTPAHGTTTTSPTARAGPWASPPTAGPGSPAHQVTPSGANATADNAPAHPPTPAPPDPADGAPRRWVAPAPRGRVRLVLPPRHPQRIARLPTWAKLGS